MDQASIKKLYVWFERFAEMSPEEEARELQALREQNEPLVLHLECLLASARRNTQTSIAFGIDDLLDAAERSQSEDLTSSIDQLSRELRSDPVHQVYRVGDFLLMRCLSVSKLGITYYAHDTVLDRDVVLLLAMPKWRSSPALRNRLVESARIVAKLFHPNVASILGTLEIDGQFLIVRQWIPGVSLQDAMLRDGPFSIHDAIQIAIGICTGLQVLHQADVLHGDLKPANIILHESSRQPVITDFGTSLWLASPQNPIWKGGTPGYIAPEILNGEDSTKSADLFSLGIILEQLQHTTPRLPSEIWDEFQNRRQEHESKSSCQSLQEQYDTLINALVQKNPTARPQSVDQVLSILNSIPRNPQVDTPNPGTSPIPQNELNPQSRDARLTRRGWLGKTIFHGLLGSACSGVAFQTTRLFNSKPIAQSPYVPGIETNHKLFFQADLSKIPSDLYYEHQLPPSELYDSEYFGISPTTPDNWLLLETHPLFIPSLDVKANLITFVCRFDLPPRHATVQLAYRYVEQTRWNKILDATNTYGGLYFKHYHLSLPNQNYMKDKAIQFRVSMYVSATQDPRTGPIPLSINTRQKKTDNALVQLLLWDRLMYKSDRSDKVET